VDAEPADGSVFGRCAEVGRWLHQRVERHAVIAHRRLQGAITAVVLVTTSYGLGSFVGRTPKESVLLLIIFISVTTFTGLVTVAVLAQRRQAELALEAYNRTL
jgi:hypothetical protein